jgi:hypothetical protein
MKPPNLSRPQRAALDKLAAGFVEDESSGMPRGVGPKAIERLLQLGYIERATCKTYGTVGVRITEKGRAALHGN